jgi:hypothetical protein
LQEVLVKGRLARKQLLTLLTGTPQSEGRNKSGNEKAKEEAAGDTHIEQGIPA